MKNILTFLLLATALCSCAQQMKTAKNETTDTSKAVTLTVKFDEAGMATKDGYYIDEYIVNISYDQAKLLDGKKIKITGTYTIVKGLDNIPKEYDKDGNEIIMQGRQGDTKHIESPTVEIIDK